MEQLWYNSQTKVVFGADSSQSPDCRPITRDEIPDLIANGATVDSSADTVPNGTPASLATGDSATLSEGSASNTETPSSVNASDSSSTETPEPASLSASSYPSDNILTSSVGSDSPNVSGSSTGIGSDSTTNAGSDLPNDPVSGAQDQSAASTSVSAPAASGASVEAVSPTDLAALHPGTTAGVSFSTPEATGDTEKEAERQADSAAIVGAGNMHLNAHQTDATGITGTKDGQPVLSNATEGYTATLKPAPADIEPDSDHPAHGLLSLLWKELEGNSFAGRARELIVKIRETL